MTRRSALTHAVPTRETDFPIKIHGENTPALPVARKGQSGRVLLRPQRDHHAATVVEFCTAAYILRFNYISGGGSKYGLRKLE